MEMLCSPSLNDFVLLYSRQSLQSLFHFGFLELQSIYSRDLICSERETSNKTFLFPYMLPLTGELMLILNNCVVLRVKYQASELEFPALSEKNIVTL